MAVVRWKGNGGCEFGNVRAGRRGGGGGGGTHEGFYLGAGEGGVSGKQMRAHRNKHTLHASRANRLEHHILQLRKQRHTLVVRCRNFNVSDGEIKRAGG